MRWIAIAVAVLGMALAAPANLLTNPGFETGTLAGWDNNGYYMGGPDNADAHSGSWGAARAVDPGIGAGAYFIMDQSVPVTAGLSYDLSGWARYVGTANNSEHFLEIQWINSSGIMWGFGSGTTPVSGPQDYTQYSLNNLIAPAGAISADVRAVVHTTGTTSGNTTWHTFDDFSFDQTVPEPTTVGLSLLGAGFCMLARRRRK